MFFFKQYLSDSGVALANGAVPFLIATFFRISDVLIHTLHQIVEVVLVLVQIYVFLFRNGGGVHIALRFQISGTRVLLHVLLLLFLVFLVHLMVCCALLLEWRSHFIVHYYLNFVFPTAIIQIIFN